MVERPLDSDTLGEKGEARFREICGDAKLIANPSTRDRAGWDFIVDFPFTAGPRSLDERPAPISARVQVKTQWDDRDDVRFSLSAAEALFKHPGPSFICVLQVNADLTFTGMRLIHCRGQILERVLRKLRETEAAKRPANGVHLHLRPSRYAERTEPTGAALRADLEAAIAADHADYVRAKDKELRTIGYAEDFLELKLSFPANDEDVVVEAFLGIRPLNDVTLSASKTRFGIKLPDTRFEGASDIAFSPRGDPCELILRTLGEIYRVPGKYYRLPGVLATSVARPKARVVTNLFSLMITPQNIDGQLQLTITFQGHPGLGVEAHKPQDWRNFYGVMRAFTGESVDIELRSRRKSVLRQTLKNNDAPDDNPQWPAVLRATQAAARVFEEAGCSNAKIPFQAVWDAGPELVTLLSMMSEPEKVSGVTFQTDSSMPMPRPGPLDMTLAHTFRVGNVVIAYAADLVITGVEQDGMVHWTSSGADLRSMQCVRSARDFDRFITRAARKPYRVVTGVYQGQRTMISRAGAP